MRPSLESLCEEHQRLHELLTACERSSTEALPESLARLSTELSAYQHRKEALYDEALRTCEAQGDRTGRSLVEIFRNNLTVSVGAVKMLSRLKGMESERVRQRLHTVSSTLRSLMETDEKSVLPICLRQETAWRKGQHATEERS